MPIIGQISVGDGATFTPAVSNEGVISWTNNKNLENPASVDIPQAVVNRYQLAPIASPAFTGNPTAPTQAKTDNSTKLATTAYVKAVAADYLALTGGEITGEVYGVTPDNTDVSTKFATTEFIDNVFLAKIISKLQETSALPAGTSFPSASVLSKMILQMNLDDGIQYDFSDPSSWYIRLGEKFGNLIVQGGTKTATFNATSQYGALYESSNLYTQTRFTFPTPFTSFYTSSISMTHSNGASLFVVKAEKGANWIQVNYIDSAKSATGLTVDIHYVVFGI